MRRRRSKYTSRQRAILSARRKWVLRIFSLLIVGSGLVYLTQWGASKLLDHDALPFRSVVIEGNFRHIETAGVRSIAEPYLGAGFFGVNVDDIKLALQDIPWLYKATVRRVWPDEIRITIYEQTAAARWGGEGLLNPESKLFFPGDADVIEGLPRLQGPPDTESIVMESYRAMSDVLKPYDLTITGLVLDERRAWQVSLNNGLKLVLGRHSTMDRLHRFVRFYPAVLASKSKMIEQIDLRYTNGFVVRWNVPQDKALNSEMG